MHQVFCRSLSHEAQGVSNLFIGKYLVVHKLVNYLDLKKFLLEGSGTSCFHSETLNLHSDDARCLFVCPFHCGQLALCRSCSRRRRVEEGCV